MAIPFDLRAKLEPAEVFHQVLEHRWYMSQARGRSVPIAEVLTSYIDDVLRHRRDEATVMGPPTDTVSLPVITGAIPEVDDDEETVVDRSEARRVGTECVSTCRSGCPPEH